jgi:hypothetical protein
MKALKHGLLPTAAQPAEALGDLRFRRLLGTEAWNGLRPEIRHRFSKRLHAARSVVYAGEIISTQMNVAGWLLAQACRMIGGPLPTKRDIGVPAVVTVTEDAERDGQFWSRQYGRHRGFPQVIHSSKRFAGPTGLEEYVGYGIGMALTVKADVDALHFCSEHYFIMIGNRRVVLPKWLSPGALTVTHRAVDDERFEFILDIQHKVFGRMVHQVAMFRETAN